MKKRNNTYWEDRANLRMASYHKDSYSTIQKISNAYDNAIRDINSDIEDIVNNYKFSGDLSDKELRRLLNTKIPNPIRKMMKKILPRIKNEDIRKYLISRLNAETYKARITRLEALKESCYLNSKLVADIELRESTKLYMNTIKKAYYTNSFDIQKGLGIGFNVAKMPDSTIQEILKNNWSGKHYSDRIWTNTDILANKLEEIITSGLMSGKSSRRMAKELEDMANCSKFAAERLIRTETTYISNMAEMESYKEDGIDKYVFVATLDLRTSSVCREHDGKVYKVDEAVSGENMPPLHPHCRSTTIAYLGEETLKNIERRARDPVTGKTYKVPADMTYKEWYDKFVVDKYGKDKTEAMEKMIKNKASDKEQLKRYQDILGKEAPKSLKEFQELKYNNSEEWNKLKQELELQFVNKDFEDIPSFHQNCSNLLTRKWYKAHDENIPNIIDKTATLKEQAKQACDLRAKYRKQARDLMRDQVERKMLDECYPSKTFEEILQHKKLKYNLFGEEAYKDILRSCKTSNKKFDEMAGIKE